jgi:ferric-dicitrate binding protein FerR (iron transport regulator)
VIEAPNVQVTAFEGRFTVEAYSPMPIAYVRVHEGRVEVRAHSVVYGFGQVVTLHAGEGARVGPDLWIRPILAPIAAHGTRSK